MSQNYFSKQAYEKFTVGADFSNVMDTDESISVSSSEVVAVDNAGTDVSDTVLVSGSKAVDSTGQQLNIRVQAGTESGSPYKITYKAVTDVGEYYEIDQYMQVKEK